MSFNEDLWNKILTWMVPAAFSGVFFLAGFISKIQYNVDELNTTTRGIETRLLLIEQTRFKNTDFKLNIKPLEQDIKYIHEDIKEIKKLLEKK